MKLNITERTYSGWLPITQKLRPILNNMMRLSFVYLALVLYSSQLLMANKSLYQELSQQNITIGFDKDNLNNILKQIEAKTSFSFVIPLDEVETYTSISLPQKMRTVEETLNLALKNTSLYFRQINKKTVLIYVKKRSETEHLGAVESLEKAKKINILEINGTVSDESGEGLPGVNVVLKGTNNGTVTDVKGKYGIEVPDQNTILIFSYVGYLSQELTVGNRSSLNVSLLPDEKSLDEVVVVGYGTAKKSDITGAVSQANIQAFKESPNVSILQSLQGSVPGLNVGAVTQAGQDPEISIRGRTSISGSNSPLIVLDGIIYRGSLVDINPNDVASIDILKDASAAAVYGSQASNGVILITSKTGKSKKKPTVEYSTSFSTQNITNKDMLPENGAGYLRKKGDRYLAQSRTGTGLLTISPDWDPTKFVSAQVLQGIQNGTETNWWNLLTNKNPYIKNHDLSISGRNELSSYFFSLGYTNQQNVVKNDDYKRYNFRINLDTKVTNWMKVGVQSFLGLSDYSGAAPSLDDVFFLPPQLSPTDANGAYIPLPDGARINPFLQIQQDNLEKRTNLFGLFYADINVPFIKGLSYRLNLSQNLIGDKNYNFNANAENFNGSAFKNNGSQYLLTVDNILSYQNNFGKHAINGTLLYGTEQRKYENTSSAAKFFSNDILGYNKLDAGKADLQTASSSAWKESSLYMMARAIYSYNDKYIFTGTVRRDGFSGFGQANKFGIFPSAALAWRLSEENFIKDNLLFVDDLKIRASYGINGNRTVGRYQTLAKIGSSVSNGYSYGDAGGAEQGQYMNSLANGDLKWESTKSLNFGADFGIFRNKITGSINTYVSNTYNLLFNVDLPVLNGFGSTPANIGKLQNTGQELTLSATAIQKKDFQWNVTFNFSRNRNKVISILGIDADKNGKEDDLISSKIFINEPYGVAYDFKTIGMWQVADQEAGIIPSGFTYGTYKVEDVNGDDKYTAAADRRILGYNDPSYRFSVMNSFKYKAWEFSFFINSIQGGKNYYYGQPGTSLPNPDNISGGNIFNFDYWTPENPNARYRQIGFYTVALGEQYSPYVQRTFVRLQNITLSYSFPKQLLEKVKITRAKLFVNGKNLVTISDWDGWDPETGSGLNRGAYPFLRNYTVGLNIEF